MSLAIDVDNVERVLLIDGWHEVARMDKGVSSFNLDAYEYLHGKIPLLLGGQVDGVPSTGASWKEVRGKGSVQVCAPLTAILAVEVRK